MDMIENRTFDELAVGDSASLTRTLTRRDIELFAVMSGDVNPAHLDDEYARGDTFHKVVAHGMWSGALVSAVLGTQLPGPGTIYLGQSLRFLKPVGLGDSVTVTVTVTALDPARRRVTLDCVVTNQHHDPVVTGTAEVIAPADKVARARVALPEVRVHERGGRYLELLAAARNAPRVRTAVVHPVDAVSLLGAVEAAREGLIEPVLVGPEAKIRRAAADAGIDLASLRIVSTEHSHAAAEAAVAMARAGEVQALMKGALHTDELMRAVVAKDSGLRTARRISHVFAMDVPTYPRPLLITDAAINVYPTLEDKRDIVQNAIDLAHALGIAAPRVAILSALETVYPKIASTIEAAALCKMAERGQISGAIVDGPMAFDLAVSAEAAATKGFVSPVAGRADILVVPDLEAGNMLAKQLEYLADAQIAGIVLGARVPIMLTSRADGPLARLASCALAALLARHQATPGMIGTP
ncbi:bifunctional enoyl-CoA hydratase/phosphate acetyltransferase [Massilia solisilvae]|uniref:Bifunctional enoyl-CoA hydratase/phosphate acetyltransferase n=1 Tax=Massilia solisilvae TaxID=1811225 RepID=A0ABT2BIM8_9BURK|nr:bifunctional enoyl-CoA hydratase/phosphate acetyltransferase [Massilia solisilvae]MCS0607920.1 bifunctional enoyl-CoA hydratase/phosphate acetyltransferase [Massilia solisilvae]